MGPVCPRCGAVVAYKLTGRPSSTSAVRPGVYKCGSCRKQYSGTVGTVFEDSHVPLNKWLYAAHLMVSSKKGISANQLHRDLGVTYKTAWFMAHRIRLAMQPTEPAEKLSGVVEADESYVGDKTKGGKRGRGAAHKVIVFSLIQRDGEARSFHVPNVKGQTLKGVLPENVLGTADIMTDNLGSYRGLAKEFRSHGVVDHGKEYVRGIIHTNFAESYFSLLKRGIIGAFHHVSEQHFQRYLNEFDFRWNRRTVSDDERLLMAARDSEGKRLTYRDSSPSAS